MFAVFLFACATVTWLAGIAVVVMYTQSCWDLWRGWEESKLKRKLFVTAAGVTFCGACAMVTAIDAMVR